MMPGEYFANADPAFLKNFQIAKSRHMNPVVFVSDWYCEGIAVDEKPDQGADQQHIGLRGWPKAPPVSAPQMNPLFLVTWMFIYFVLLAV